MIAGLLVLTIVLLIVTLVELRRLRHVAADLERLTRRVERLRFEDAEAAWTLHDGRR